MKMLQLDSTTSALDTFGRWVLDLKSMFVDDGTKHAGFVKMLNDYELHFASGIANFFVKGADKMFVLKHSTEQHEDRSVVMLFKEPPFDDTPYLLLQFDVRDDVVLHDSEAKQDLLQSTMCRVLWDAEVLPALSGKRWQKVLW